MQVEKYAFFIANDHIQQSVFVDVLDFDLSSDAGIIIDEMRNKIDT